MQSALDRSRKRTIVRRSSSAPAKAAGAPDRKRRRSPAPPFAVAAARVGLRLLTPASPSLAAAYAERLFLTAPRHPRPAQEVALLETAEPFHIPHEGSFLPAWRWGAGAATVLLVHGWQGRGSQLGAFVAPLLAAGLSVVTFDAPGHGDAPSRRASLVEHARAVATVGAYLGPLHGIIAHSVGGGASLYATRLGLRVDRLALVAPPVSPERFAAGFAKMFALTDGVREGMLDRLEARYGVPLDELDVCQDAARATGPILVVHDVGDQVVPIEEGATLVEHAPNATLVKTQGLGHNRVLRAPVVLDAIIPFMTRGVSVEPFAATIQGELFFRDRRWL